MTDVTGAWHNMSGGGGSGYHYDKWTGTYRDSNGDYASWNEVYYNYIVPNSVFSINLLGILSESIINDPAVLPQSAEDYQKQADYYNNNETWIEGNDTKLAEMFNKIFYMSLGMLDLRVLTTNSGKYGMTSKGLYYNFSDKTFVGGYTLPEGSGWSIHISPYCLGNEVYFRAYAGHELIHLYHGYKTSYGHTYSEMVAYKYTVDVLNMNNYYDAANAEMSAAKSRGYWSPNPGNLVTDRAYIWVMGGY